MLSHNNEEVTTMAGIIVGGIVLLSALVIGLIWVFGARAKARLAAQYPPPGQMVDVGGYRMHILCQGDHVPGSPTVVMEGGNGEPCLTWAAVQPGIAKFAHVCTYDRAGLGWSEHGSKPRTAGNIVDELHSLLMQAGVQPPYVLVGHSMGGGLVRLYAHEHPDQVAGLVLVDPLHEEQEGRLPEATRRLNERGRKAMVPFFRLGQMAAASGLPALFPKLLPRQALATVPREAYEAYSSFYLSGPKQYEAVIQETSAVGENYEALRAAHITTLGDIPLLVLSAPDQFAALERYLSAEDLEQTKAVSNELHTELAALSSNGKRVIVRDSRHYIHVDQPQAVIDAIREVVEAAQR
jgi:pimeloyl-ACP methyl ester carboxylesterase